MSSDTGHIAHSGAQDAVLRDAARLLPGPFTAQEHAATEASLHQSSRQPTFAGLRLTKTRIAVGAATVALAVTIPDLSLGAMGTPYMRIDMGQSAVELPDSIWTPVARPTGPVYAPVMTAEEIAPAAVTYSSRSNFGNFDRVMPLELLQSGSERFDLAFAGVELPTLETVTLSSSIGIEPIAAPFLTEATPAPMAHLVEVQQITVSRGFEEGPAPGLQVLTGSLTPSVMSDSSVAAANESIEAAFAGAIDVSSEVRRSIPVAATQQPSIPEPTNDPTNDPVARAVPIPPVDPSLSASAAAQIELVEKTQMDARVNGVLTGSVDFRQANGTIAIRLRSIVDVLQSRFSASEIDHIMTGQSIDSFVTLAELQAAGVPIRYNAAYDEVEFGIDYNDAPEAVKVQVEQIGAPTLGTERAMIDQIPR